MPCWHYSRCPSCPHTHRQVFPSGPVRARVALIGESPGKNEDRLGIPFVGRSGEEQDYTYFRLAGIDRDDVFVSNATQCRSERNNVDIKPQPALVSSCAENHLREELWTVQPEIVILAGATACSLAGIDDLEMEHGFPRWGRLFGWECWVVPMYHPAAGMHEARFMIPLLEDWARLGKWLKGEWEPPQSTIKPNYRLIERSDELDDYNFSTQVAIDTETDEGKPYSVQCSVEEGSAFMVLAENTDVVGRLSDRLHADSRGTVSILHNASYDLEVLESMGIRVVHFRDTMQELYHLGNFPQGLKAAVYRIFGHKMTSYDEVVTPHSKRVLAAWLDDALVHCYSNRPIESHPIGKGCPTCGKNHKKDCSKEKSHEAEAVLRRAQKNIDGDYDPWEQPKWAKGEEKCRLLGRAWLGELEQAVGRMPRRSIVHAPMDRQIQYACEDAMWTGMLARWLEKERGRIVREEWRVCA